MKVQIKKETKFSALHSESGSVLGFLAGLD